MKAIITPKFQPSPTVAEPFLWAHLALVFGVPWLLGLCLAGLAVGEPILPSGLEILLIAAPAIAIPAWWQWQKPLSPFSIWLAAKPINELTPPQLKILTLLKDLSAPSQPMPARSELIAMIRKFSFPELIQAFTPTWNPTGWVAIAVALFLFSAFRQLYQIAPLATDFAPFPAVLRLLGLIWALIFLSLSSLILQMGISAARLLLVSPALFAQIQPFPANQVKANFTSFGMRLPKIFDFAISETKASGTRTKSASGGISFEVEDTNPLFKPVLKLWQTVSNLFSKKPNQAPTQTPIQTKVTREPISINQEVKPIEAVQPSEVVDVVTERIVQATLVTQTTTEASAVTAQTVEAATETKDQPLEAMQSNPETTQADPQVIAEPTETRDVTTEALQEPSEIVATGSSQAIASNSESEKDLEQNPEVSNDSQDQDWV